MADLNLTTDGIDIKIGTITMPINLSDIKVDGTSIATKDDNYLTQYGIVIESPEDSVEDEEYELTIPEEQLKGELIITSK